MFHNKFELLLTSRVQQVHTKHVKHLNVCCIINIYNNIITLADLSFLIEQTQAKHSGPGEL